MYREAVKFWIPHTNGIRQTKSFTAYKLRSGLNYAQFLGLPKIKTTQKSTSIADDFTEKVVIQLPEMREGPATAQKITPVQKVKHTAAGEPPTLTITHTPHTPASELGGSVTVLDHTGNKLTPDTHTGALGSTHLEAPGKSEEALANTDVTSDIHKHTTTHTHT